jgi:hypothetical protein
MLVFPSAIVLGLGVCLLQFASSGLLALLRGKPVYGFDSGHRQ